MDHKATARTEAGPGPALDDAIELAREIRIALQGAPLFPFMPPALKTALPLVVRLAESLASIADQVKTHQVNQVAILQRLSVLEGTAGVNEFAAELAREVIPG
jgi:hypothetical protein